MNTNSPPSPSITTVSTYRDNKLIDLPWNLLVEGDIVLLGPSETAPTQIKQVYFSCKLEKLSKCHALYNFSGLLSAILTALLLVLMNLN